MPMKTGTHDIGSLLAVTNQSAAAFGVDRINEILQADLAAHNRIVREDLLGTFVDITTDRQRVSGVSTSGTMMEVDEYGAGPTQKQDTPPSLGFPLRLFQWPIGWTEKWMQTKTPADLAIQQQGAETAHLNVLQREIKKSFFLSGNYTFVDKLVDRVSLYVKRLANADSFAIPDGPNAQNFDSSTHTHYLAENGITAAGVTAAVNTVVEHGVRGPVRIAISSTDETAFRALTGFVAAADPRLILATNANQARDRLDILVLNDRLIGYFGAAEVWVKPWAIANYVVIFDNDPANKPLVLRQRDTEALQGLRIAAKNSAFPLTAEFFEAEFGVGVWLRTRAAVYYFGGGTYTDPTIT